jgi:thiosulfate/3-mercaptopyruvate sulfurtransferase
MIPLLVEPSDLANRLTHFTVLDACRPDTYARVRVPGALHFPLQQVMCKTESMAGAIPPFETLSHRMQSLGLETKQPILLYDEEGGMAAGRLFWTLQYLGFQKVHYLNGGLLGWVQGKHPIEQTQPRTPTPSNELFQSHPTVLATLDEIEAHLGDSNIILLDTRPVDYYNKDHIPGAVSFPTAGCIDRLANMRLTPLADLEKNLQEKGVTKDKTIICYCHAFHSAAVVYMVLKLLGYPQVKGYVGSWSEWGKH